MELKTILNKWNEIRAVTGLPPYTDIYRVELTDNDGFVYTDVVADLKFPENIKKIKILDFYYIVEGNDHKKALQQADKHVTDLNLTLMCVLAFILTALTFMFLIQ